MRAWVVRDTVPPSSGCPIDLIGSIDSVLSVREKQEFFLLRKKKFDFHISLLLILWYSRPRPFSTMLPSIEYRKPRFICYPDIPLFLPGWIMHLRSTHFRAQLAIIFWKITRTIRIEKWRRGYTTGGSWWPFTNSPILNGNIERWHEECVPFGVPPERTNETIGVGIKIYSASNENHQGCRERER